MDIVGHTEVRTFFDTVVQARRLSHAYCFAGPAAVGKRTVGVQLAAKILGTSVDKIESHPDYILVTQEKNKKTGKTKKHIDIEQMHALRERITRRAFAGAYKVAIIDGAEKLNQNAANALLKTLEEPRSDTCIILVTDNDQQLPRTIRSRCQTLYFAPVSVDAIRDHLQEVCGVGVEVATELAQASSGRIGWAKDWAVDNEGFELHKQYQAYLTDMIGMSFGEKLQKIDALFGDKKDHIADRERLRSVIHVWQMTLPALHTKRTLSGEQMVHLYDAMNNARFYLQKNIHPRLLLERVLLQMP